MLSAPCYPLHPLHLPLSLPLAQQLRLKQWFPGADVGAVVGRRPSLLGAEEFARVPAARAALLAHFGGQDGGGGGQDGSAGGGGDSGGSSAVVDALVTEQPLLLVDDVGEVLAELRR